MYWGGDGMMGEVLGSQDKRVSEKNESDVVEQYISTNKDLEKMIEMAGYSYDPLQDIFVSTLNPWQRDVGYCRLYDEAAAPLGMIIDSEPILFEYNNQKWMIGFWKGQYDLVTGGEIGIYKEAFDISLSGIVTGTFYNSVSNDEMLQMSFTLIKKGKKLFSREAKHWWLTGFMLGEFSEPSELKMEISMTLENINMRDAFVSGLRKAGYSDQEFTVTDNIVNFIFDVPHTAQPVSRIKEFDRIIQEKNKFLCDEFQELTKSYDTLPAKLIVAAERSPDLYANIFNSGKTKALYETVTVIIRIGTFLLASVSGSQADHKKV